MSNFEEHLQIRSRRYNEFVLKPTFKEGLIGLHHIELNLAENCTRKCFFCPRHDPLTYPNIKQYMSMSTVNAFIDRIVQSSYAEEIHLTGFGEPLMHPNIIEIISLLRNNLTNYISLTTNGDLFQKYKPFNLYEAGISNITVSCYEQEAYNNLLSLFSNVESNKFFIRKLWTTSEPNSFLVQNSFTLRHNNNQVTKQKSCYIPFYKMFIDYNGDVLLCSNDWYRKHKLKLNINTHTLEEIWFNEEVQKTRSLLLQNKRTAPACSSCKVSGTLMGNESVKLHEKFLTEQ
jgi:radical SAM protein with 4Fe4S-binding SPASM domain